MNQLPKNSLKILPKDPRDFNLGAVFPQIDIKKVPTTDFIVTTPLVIKNQGETDYCSAYALTSVSEDQEGIEFIPEYQFFRIKEISGKPKEWGADLRDACRSATDYGSLPVRYWPKKELTREEINDRRTWPSSSESVGRLYKKESYFSIKGKYDVFDNIRCALYQHRADKCTILTGALWRQSWLDSSTGILPPIYEDDGFGHAFKIFGQKVIKEQMYLMAQLSQGEEVGDKGIFYLSREIVNKEIGPFGIFMFKDVPREEVEASIEQETLVGETKMSFWDWIKSLFRKKIYA